ncbi:MAG: hypothetical protein LV479_09015 [Methylacidiphilales bacterium]|nr:hypothetical protein [Candidatus Methylacidiphilales bacterium]
MSSVWTIRDATGVEKTAAEWGLCGLTRERINQRPDLVTFRAENGASDADPIFAHGSTILIFRNGTPWFYGRVIEVPGRASAKAEEQLYRVAGPWWYLENLVFQQAWQTTNGVDVTLISTNKSRLILNQKGDGSKLATGAAILEVLNYATARGVPMTIGSVTPNATAPYAEELDQSCAEVIRNFLRWTPDAAAAFDYTTTPYPTLSILRRADASTLMLPAYGAPVSKLELTPRHDLQAPSVVLKFEQTNDIDNDTFTSLIVQPAPSTATGDELGAMVMTLDLAGARETYQKQKVRTAFIPPDSSSAGVVDWWKGKFPWLSDFDDTDLTVVAGSHTVTMEDPADYPGLTLSNVPNELLEGSVAAWMNLYAAPLRVQATMQYTGAATDESTEVFGPTNQRVLYTRVIGTNAETQTYSRLTSETAAEPVPAGLAQALYDAVSVLPYDGTIELTEEECSGVGAPGNLLNLTGGRAEWSTMAAQIQRIEEQIDAGITRLTVGPGKHLGHGDLAELLRVNRQRRPSWRLNERTSGNAGDHATKVQGGEQSPRSDSIFRPSAGSTETNKPFELLDASDATGLKVVVNANSFLQKSLTPNDTVAVTGLGAAIAVTVGSLIWLELDFTSYAVTSAAIGSGTSGWSGFPNPFVYTGTSPNQVMTTAYLLIGYLAAASSTLDGTVITGGSPSSPVSAKIIQCVSQNLLLRNGCFNGLPAIFPFPHHAPYV